MPKQSSARFLFNCAKERLDEMDAMLASLETKAGVLQAESRAKADQRVADLRTVRDTFRTVLDQQAQAGEAAWQQTRDKLEAEWGRFEAKANAYFESLGNQIEQQQATFRGLMDAQLKAWRDMADEVHAAAGEFAAPRRGEIDAAAGRVRAEAATAQENLQKLTRAGSQSWTAFSGALAQSRAAFDRANQNARDALKEAVSR